MTDIRFFFDVFVVQLEETKIKEEETHEKTDNDHSGSDPP